MRNTRFEIRPTSGALGAELLGIDLADSLDAEGAAEIRAALNEHGVVFFRGQNLESSELLVMSVDVAAAPAFTAGTPKLLFKLPGPLGGNLGNISRDGQRFVFAVNVPAAGTGTR